MIGVVDYADAYRKIFHLFGRDDMLDDERFNTISAVQQHLDEFMPILRGYFKTKTRDEWVDLIAGLNIVVGKIGHLKDLATDEQAIANEFVQDVEFPSGKKVAMPTVPIEFSAYDTKSKYEKTGEIGRDTEAVLGEVGYTKEQAQPGCSEINYNVLSENIKMSGTVLFQNSPCVYSYNRKQSCVCKS